MDRRGADAGATTLPSAPEPGRGGAAPSTAHTEAVQGRAPPAPGAAGDGGASATIAAARARFADEHGGGPGDARGAAALAWLARVIDDFAGGDATAQAEGGFLDGAGATLAVVLVDAIPSARLAARDGAIRVALGHGSLDPFAAVARALEGPSARAALVAEVGRAEAEAAGHGPIARVARALDGALAARDLSPVAERFDRRVWLADGTEIDLARAVAATEGEPDAAVLAWAEKIASMLAGAPPIPRAEALERLVPRLVGPSFDVPAALALLPGPADLRVGLVVAFGDRARFVSSRDLSRWGLDPEAALAQAVRNLAARSARARFARIDTAAGPLVLSRTGDGLDAARLLLPALFETLAPELGEPFLAAVPHRDALWCAADREGLRTALQARVDDDHARAPHRISRAIVAVHAPPARGAGGGGA